MDPDRIWIKPESFGVLQRVEASREATKRGKGLRMEVHSSHTEFHADATVPVGQVAVHVSRQYKGRPTYETTLATPEAEWPADPGSRESERAPVAELEHDEDLPYAVVNGDRMVARFRTRGDAEVFSENSPYGCVIDTTPKPRVPDDAKFLCWVDTAGYICVAARGDDGWHYDGDLNLTEEYLFENYIGGAIFTVLDERKQ